MVTITAELTEEQAEALAQFIKRAGHSTFKEHAKNEAEAYTMLIAANTIGTELAHAGFNPR